MDHQSFDVWFSLNFLRRPEVESVPIDCDKTPWMDQKKEFLTITTVSGTFLSIFYETQDSP